MVAHRDRLARFGFEIIQWLVERNGGTLLVLNQQDASPESELTEDILAILHNFSCLLHGLRRYRSAVEKDPELSEQGTEENHQTVVDAARWCYNQTIETLRQSDTTANWKKIKTPIIKAIPSHLAPAPYQVKSIAVRDDCKAVSNAKIFNIGRLCCMNIGST